MTRSFAMLALIVVAPAFALPVAAQEPNLVGDWEAVELRSETFAGKRWTEETTQFGFTITTQDGRILTGTRHFRTAADTPGHDGSAEVVERTSDVIGVVDVGGEEFHLVSKGTTDAFFFEGEIIDADTIDVVGYEPGDKSWVMHMTLKRKQ
jgi:hypothetical protein